MTNHPGRKPGLPSPEPDLIRATRDGCLQTQEQAASVVHATRRTWQDWESGARRMPRVAWEVYLLHHCRPGGMLRAGEWSDWLRPEFAELVS